MKERYIVFFKRELVFLLILLIVICFSFGVTYSNFVYKSDNYRAVEIYTSELKYNVTINNKSTNAIEVKPGNNVVKVTVESLNQVKTYFKIASKGEAKISYFNNDNNIINNNEKKEVTLLIFNNKNENDIVELKVLGGFFTNTIDDIKIDESYKEITNNVKIGDNVSYNDKEYRLLSIDQNGNYELISSFLNVVNISGYTGYNNYIQDINKEKNTKCISIEDLEKYLKKEPLFYSNSKVFYNAYYPLLWKYEIGSIINGEDTLGFVNRSGKFIIEDTNSYFNNISVSNLKINELEFIDPIYESIFNESNYLIATRFNSYNDTKAYFGVLSLENGKIKENILYDSNNINYNVSGSVRVIQKVLSNNNLFN